MNHPLTDKILYEIELAVNEPFYRTEAYIRAGADWQLERDTEYFLSYLTTVLGWDPEIAKMRMDAFRKTMRPE